jgi:hypothetical protein
MHALHTVDPAPAAVVFTDDPSQLARVREAGVQAVVLERAWPHPWEHEVAQAVEDGAFVVERRNLMVERSEALIHALEQRLPPDGLRFETRLALIDDLAALAERLTAIAGCRGVMLRLFTEAPTDHCGFHVDTVAPGNPPFAMLKVYNGSGTHYVEPVDVVRMRDFYAYLGRRERLAREWRGALDARAHPEAERLHAALRALDAALPFLRPSASVHEVPAGATVAFRTLDLREHWSEHGTHRAWIHCSPMAGVIRLVASLTPLDGPPARPR